MEPRLIADYLLDLRRNLGSRPDAEDIVAEAEDHLRESAQRLVREGVTPALAERRALGSYGAVDLVSREFSASGKGVAVPSRFTRIAGLAALSLPVAIAAGALINEGVPRGPVHGLGVALLVLAFPLGILFFAGLWKRHGGALGRLGKVALGLMIASPVLSVPFAWGAGVAFVAFIAIATTMLALAVARAGMLPPLPAVLLAVGPAFMIAAGAVGASAGFDGTLIMPLGLLPFGTGLLWLGWVLAREHPAGLLAA